MSAKQFNSHTPGLQDDTDLGFDHAFVGPVLELGFDTAGASGSGGGGKLKTYTSGDPSIPNSQEFNIQINFSGKWTAEQQAAAIAAANAWSRIITGDIHDDTDLKGNLVDDIVIDLRIGRIDGLGIVGTDVNTLAATGNFVVRDAGTQDQLLPLTASIRLDVADLQNPDTGKSLASHHHARNGSCSWLCGLSFRRSICWTWRRRTSWESTRLPPTAAPFLEQRRLALERDLVSHGARCRRT